MIAYCGLVCDQCPIHLATTEQYEPHQKTMRESIAEECTIQYGLNLQPEDINDCEGCKSSTGRIFSGCSNCEIRKCAIANNIESCTFCGDYACDRLKQHFLLDPGAQSRLEEYRNN